MKNLQEYIVEGIFDVDDNIDSIDKSIKGQIKQFLKDNFKGHSNCKISRNPNSDGKYEVSCNGHIEVKNYNITSLTNSTFIWTKVNGDFDCSNCKSLISLKGAPKEVGRVFKCSRCTSLTSLEGTPKEVGGDFECCSCHSLTSLEGAPKEVGGDFDCSNCKSLISLKGAPKEVGRGFYCGICNLLTSLEGAPKEIGGDFYCAYCTSLTSLEGASKEVGKDFHCGGCGVKFTMNDVKKVSNVEGNIYV